MKRLLLAALVFVSTLLVWAPFLMKIDMPLWNFDFKDGGKILWQNFDGPNYLIIERTWYARDKILENFSNPLPAEYYPAHFPLYPAIIGLFDMFFTGPWAMLLSTLAGSILCIVVFYEYLRQFKLSDNAKWLAVLFLFFPARWVAVRSVGSPEPWFIAFILLSMLFFKKGRYFWAGIFGALAQLTKSPAIILFAAYGLVLLTDSIKQKKIIWKAWPIVSMVLAIPLLFWFYGKMTGDFWAYFNSGDNIHLFWPPFSVFAPKGQVWVGNFWLEDIIWTWAVLGVGVISLRNKKLKLEHYFAGLYFLSTLFVAHRDISRYILPVVPFALIGLDEIVSRKEVKIVAMILVVPILIYTWNFLLHNTAPVADWAPYL